jgi:hypothetical protein
MDQTAPRKVKVEVDRRLLVLALGMFALGTDNFVVAGVLPEIARGFHIGIGAAGQLTTIYALSFGLLAPTVAALGANAPRKRLLVAGLGIFVDREFRNSCCPQPCDRLGNQGSCRLECGHVLSNSGWCCNCYCAA